MEGFAQVTRTEGPPARFIISRGSEDGTEYLEAPHARYGDLWTLDRSSAAWFWNEDDAQTVADAVNGRAAEVAPCIACGAYGDHEDGCAAAPDATVNVALLRTARALVYDVYRYAQERKSDNGREAYHVGIVAREVSR